MIGEANEKAQPKKGIESSSFLATKASGGNRKFNSRVSQVDECLDMTICGEARGGMFSTPMMRWRMPQIQRAPKSMSQHQPMMNRNRDSRGNQNRSRTSVA